MEFKNPLPYEINISGSANGGFIVQVGCCTCTFSDKNTMLAAIEDYTNDPKKMEEAYNESVPQALARDRARSTAVSGSSRNLSDTNQIEMNLVNQ